MGYDKENRLVTYLATGTSVSYVYAGSSLKRTEWNAGTPTTLLWENWMILNTVSSTTKILEAAYYTD